MKLNEKIEARKLRSEQGLSIKAIASLLKVTASSVSVWVRDIELSNDQKEILIAQNPIFNNQLHGSLARKNKAREKRIQYQQEGRIKARENNPLHIKGCMLYWAEGAKSRRSIKFANTDVEMIILFTRFLKESLLVKDDQITLHTHVYLNNGLDLQDIENYWLNKTNLRRSNLRKSSVNIQPISSKGLKRNKLIYGVCYLNVHSTQLVQHIYGAIQEYSNFSDDKFLNLLS